MPLKQKSNRYKENNTIVRCVEKEKDNNINEEVRKLLKLKDFSLRNYCLKI